MDGQVSSVLSRFDLLLEKAETYHQAALRQEQYRLLQEAEAILDEYVLNDPAREQRVLLELGGVRRRLGQYERAVQTLNDALHANEGVGPLMRASILGELGVTHRHSNDFARAREIFHEQFKLAEQVYLTADAATEIEAEAEMCRAVGNEAMSVYNLYKQTGDQALLGVATRQCQERVERAKKLHARLQQEQPSSRFIHQTTVWTIIGLQRLSLCQIAKGNTSDAVETALASLEMQAGQRKGASVDPQVTGHTLFHHGNALWADGQHEAALRAWNPADGRCNPAIAICKEPAAEHTEYIRQLADAGVDFDGFDDQGFSALDYAELSNNKDARGAIEIIKESSRRILRESVRKCQPILTEDEIEARVETEIERRHNEARLRCCCRGLLQDVIRPELRKETRESLQQIRQLYAASLARDSSMQNVLDWYHYVDYKEFVDLGRLPLADEFRPGTRERWARLYGEGSENMFIIFFSYRWIGQSSTSKTYGPDDANHTQYRRMLDALSGFLALHRRLDPTHVGIWLDCACISQLEVAKRVKGINALPLAVAQCDAVISLDDEEYFDRAWCAVEVMLVCQLARSYKLHTWWRHLLSSPDTDACSGMLERGDTETALDLAGTKLTEEIQDRPKVQFLERQSRLLGKDNA